jgi:KTSC domain
MVGTSLWWRRWTCAGEAWRLTDDSSVFRWLKYSRRTRELTAEFRSVKRYAFHGVSPADAKELFTSDSAGRCFNRLIRPIYTATRVP